MNKQRYLLVVSGPSGIGKDTVVQNLIDTYDNIELSVSVTTRKPRDYEVNAEHYYFTTEMEFMRRVKAGEFVEYTCYAGNYYGTLKSEVEKRMDNDITCVLVIEVNGSEKVKEVYPECTTVFVQAPNMTEHERRLRRRGCESEQDMAERMRIAVQEMKLADEYDYRVMNDDAQRCADELHDILIERQTE